MTAGPGIVPVVLDLFICAVAAVERNCMFACSDRIHLDQKLGYDNRAVASFFTYFR